MTVSSLVLVVRPSPCFTKRYGEESIYLDLFIEYVYIYIECTMLRARVVPTEQAKTTKKIVLKLQCVECKIITQAPIKVCLLVGARLSVWKHSSLRRFFFFLSKICLNSETIDDDEQLMIVFFLIFWGAVKQRCKHFEIGGDKKSKGQMY